MGDRTNFELDVKDVSPQLRKHIRDLFMDGGPTYVYNDDETDTRLILGGNDMDLDSASEMHSTLHELVENGFEADCDKCGGEGTGVNGSITIPCPACKGDGVRTYPVPDFRWMLETDDKYEFPGDLLVHVPGMEDHHGVAGGVDHNVRVSDVLAALDSEDDVAALKARLIKLTGRDVIAAFNAEGPYVAPTPEPTVVEPRLPAITFSNGADYDTVGTVLHKLEGWAFDVSRRDDDPVTIAITGITTPVPSTEYLVHGNLFSADTQRFDGGPISINIEQITALEVL
jgi:hypothetical protein